MMIYEENFTSLRDLEPGDVFINKMNSVGTYVKSLEDDHHIIKNEDGKEWEVPHGRFPVFKKIIK